MKIKLSKKQWQEIGKTAGWMNKQASPPPINFTEEDFRGFKDEGLVVNPEGRHDTQWVSAQRDFKKISEALTAQGFEGIDPKNALFLPYIAKADASKIVDIDGVDHYIMSQDENTILAVNVETNLPKQFNTSEVQVTASKTPKNNLLKELNKMVKIFNRKNKFIENQIGHSRLALQLKWGEKEIDKRLAILNKQIDKANEKVNNPVSSPALSSALDREMGKLSELSEQDQIDTVWAKYEKKAKDLVNALNNNEIPVSERAKTALLNLANMSIDNESKAKTKEKADWQKREEDVKDLSRPVGENTDMGKLSPLTPEDIPHSDPTALKPQYKQPENITGQAHKIVESASRDISELTTIKNALNNLRRHVGELQEGERANVFLQSPEGETTISETISALQKMAAIFRRYKEPVIVENKPNIKLFGIGTAGNASVVIVLQSLYNVLYKTLEKLGVQLPTPDADIGGNVAPETTDVTVPEKEPVKASSNCQPYKYSQQTELWDNFIRRILK